MAAADAAAEKARLERVSKLEEAGAEGGEEDPDPEPPEIVRAPLAANTVAHPPHTRTRSRAIHADTARQLNAACGGAQFTVTILRLIKDSQAQNGLRHNDYQRYRQYCSRRLHRLRRSLNFKHGKKRYQKKLLTADLVTDERFLHIPLVAAERCWSYAMQLKEEMVEQPRKKHHMVQKMNKAARCAYELLKLCKERADERTQLEAEAYAAFMFGNVLLEKERWKQAQMSFVKARNAYSELARLVPSSEDKAADTQKMFASMSDELTPSIMYCQYNAKKHGGGAMDADDAALKELLEGGADTPAMELLKSKLSGSVEDTRAAEAKSLTQVGFRGTQLKISDEKLSMAIITAREELKEVAGEKGLDKKMDRFGRVSVAYDDAMTIVSRELQAKRGDGAAPDVVAELQSMEIYLNFCKEQAEVDRNLVLAESYRRRLAINGERQEPGSAEDSGKTTKPDELVAIYDKLINNCSEMLELPGVDESEIEKGHFSARLMTFKSLRCMYMGEAFRAQASWPEAYVLYERAAELAAEAKKRHTNLKGLTGGQTARRDEDVSRIEEAIVRIDGLRPLVHASAFLQSNKQIEGSASGDGTLQDTIDTYARPASLAPFPPGFMSTSCKPILVDLVRTPRSYPRLLRF
jgi:signal recognition particle subunit SRP68